jgi:holo-[acyl-carrier protein] synthase
VRPHTDQQDYRFQLAAIAGSARPSHFRAMIIGIGSDLCDIRRIEKSLARFGERFTHRVFTEGERSKSDRRATRAASYARRFAAKEACSKALGTGMRLGVFWRDMEVVNLPSGKPTMRLTGGAGERLAGMVPAGYEAVVHVSLTDDPPLAQAFVIIEAVRREERAPAAP